MKYPAAGVLETAQYAIHPLERPLPLVVCHQFALTLPSPCLHYLFVCKCELFIWSKLLDYQPAQVLYLFNILLMPICTYLRYLGR